MTTTRPADRIAFAPACKNHQELVIAKRRPNPAKKQLNISMEKT